MTAEASSLTPSLPRPRAHRHKPPPPGFEESFVRWGWRGVETIFGSGTHRNVRWVDECGGDQLKARRKQYVLKVRELRYGHA